MIVPLAPLAFGLFSRIRRAACWPTRNALNAELRIVSNAMVGSASMIPLRKMPGTRPSMLCTTSVGAPSSPATLWNRNSTEAGSLASHAYRRTPWAFSRACRTGLSAFRAAMATRMPSLANSLAQLELMPGPPPTMSATSCRTVDVSISVIDRIPLFHAMPANEARGLVRSARALTAVVSIVTRSGRNGIIRPKRRGNMMPMMSSSSIAQHLRPDIGLVDPAVQAPHAWPREHQVEEDDTEQDRRIGTIERPVGHRYLGRRGQGGDAGVESNGDQHAAHHLDHSGTRVQRIRHAGLREMQERDEPLIDEQQGRHDPEDRQDQGRPETELGNRTVACSLEHASLRTMACSFTADGHCRGVDHRDRDRQNIRSRSKKILSVPVATGVGPIGERRFPGGNRVTAGRAGLSHVVAAKISVVSTKARRAARRDLLSPISCLSLKQGLLCLGDGVNAIALG